MIINLLKIFFCLISGLFLIPFAAYAQTNYETALALADSVYSSAPDSSYQICCKVEQRTKKAKNSSTYLKALLCKARYDLLKSNLEECGRSLNDVLQNNQNPTDSAVLARTYKLKAILQGRLGNDKEEIDLDFKALGIYRRLNVRQEVTGLLLNLSYNLTRLKEYDKAAKIFTELHQNAKNIKGKTNYYYHQNYGLYCTAVGNYKKAISEFETAGTIAQKENMHDSYVSLLTSMATPYKEMGEYKKAEQLLLKSKYFAEAYHLNYELSEALEALVDFYVQTNDFRSSLNALQQKIKIDAEILNIEKLNRINEFEKRIKLTEKEKIIAQQDLDLIKKKSELSSSKSQNVILFAILLIIIVIAAFSIVMFLRTRRLKNRIYSQKHSIEQKSKIIEEAYINITDSLQYSKRLQEALLPPRELFINNLSDYFILYKPKDIVSGDFYWAEKRENTLFIAVADCTGHGVPGAMLSVAGSNALNRCINEFNLSATGKILDKLSEIITENFNHSTDEVKDGMDISLLSLKLREGSSELEEIQWSGANNPLWIIEGNSEQPIANSKQPKKDNGINPSERPYSLLANGSSLKEIKADKQPIGKFDNRKPFTTHYLNLNQGACLYLFTDGYADQFGGPQKKKFKYARMKELILNNHSLSFNRQSDILNSAFTSWKDNDEQVDDVCIIGIKL